MCAYVCFADTEELIPPQSKSEGNFMEGMQDEMRQNVTSYVSRTLMDIYVIHIICQMKMMWNVKQDKSSEMADTRPFDALLIHSELASMITGEGGAKI